MQVTILGSGTAGPVPHPLPARHPLRFHPAPCADLGPLLFALRNPRYAGRKPLAVFAAAGLERFVRTLTDVWSWIQPKDYQLAVREIGPGELSLGKLQVRAVPIRHTAQSLGYRFAAEG